MSAKTFINLIGFYICLFSSSILYGQEGLTRINEYGINPGNLSMYMHIPKSEERGKKMPLVVVLHGCTQNAAVISRQSGWNKLADDYGFYVLYPQQKYSNNLNGCFNWYRKKDAYKDKGEIGSIKEMIDFVIDSFNIDSNRIFSYGLSAGAAMSVALLADYPDLFNAGAVLAGGPFGSATNPISGLHAMMSPPSRTAEELAKQVTDQQEIPVNNYPRLIIVHGKTDPVVNFKNAKQLVQQWTFLHQTDTIADTIMHSFEKHPDITKLVYRDGLKNDVVIFYEVSNLGHALMVDPGDRVDQGGDTGMFAVDRDFFSTYWIAVDFGLINH